MKKFSTAAAILFTVLGVFSAQAKLNPEKASKMEYKQFGSQYFIRINPGQELVSTLKEFCKAKKITLATVSGIGSLKSVTLGFFNPESKKYDQKTFNEYMEMAGLTGNVMMKDGEPVLHLHTVVAGDNYKALAGHMAEAQVSLTAEIVIETVKGKIEKTYDKNTGLNLMDFNGISPAFKFKILRKVSDIDGNYQSFALIFADKGQQIAVQRQLAITSVSQDF